MHIYKYRDIEYQLYGAPVEPYLNKNKIKLEAPSTSNWRGYQGFWRLSADRLYIVKLESANMTFSDVFNTQEEVFAEWYTGSFTFVVPNVVSKSSRLTNMTDHYFIDSILSPLRTAYTR
jgi:hypothetical protein